jgi:hypothetical protein
MQLAIHEHATVEEASADLLDFILSPANWLSIEQLTVDPSVRPAQNALYQRRVGPLRICASVEVASTLEVFLRVAFRAPGLTPVKAADHLETFLRSRLPLTPNTEWQVEVDERRWIHFVRRYASARLQA